MGKEAIVKRLLGLGIIVTPEILKKIETVGIDTFLDNVKKDSCMVIGEVGSKGEELVCCVHNPPVRVEMTPEDIIKTNAKKYESIKKMLLRKVDAVSINNIGKSSNKISVVGMVKDKTREGFVIEDGTGEVEVKTKEHVELDDVISVLGWLRGRTLFAEEIIYPDIPMNREVNSLDTTLLLTTDSVGQKKDADIVVTPVSIIDKERKEHDIQSPAWIFLTKREKKMTIMVYEPGENIRKENSLSWLKKRYVGTDNLHGPEDERILNTIPDILWVINNNDPFVENYKGVTLVSFGKGHNAFIDLKTRKVKLS